MPEFLLQPDVRVKKLLLTDHGIFFFFFAPKEGRAQYTCLAYMAPTKELYDKYFEPEPVAPPVVGKSIHDPAVKAAMEYDTFDREVHRVLGLRDAQYCLVHFDRVYQPLPRLTFENPLVFHVHGHAVSFQPLMDVYYRE